MFAKTLLPGPPIFLPTLTATTIEPDQLQLVVAEQVLIDDVNPASPQGWWAAVDALDGRCVAIVLRSGDVDLTGSDLNERMKALMAEPGSGAWAIVAITHDRF